MNRTKLIKFICLIIGIAIGVLVSLYFYYKERDPHNQYFKPVSAKEYEESYGIQFRQEHYYDCDTTSIATTRKEIKGVVTKPQTAYKISYYVLADKYGEDYANKAQPFKLSLINGKVWKIISKDTSAIVYIQKIDARILKLTKYVLLGVLVGCAVTKFVHSSYSIRKKKVTHIFMWVNEKSNFLS